MRFDSFAPTVHANFENVLSSTKGIDLHSSNQSGVISCLRSFSDWRFVCMECESVFFRRSLPTFESVANPSENAF